MGTPRPERVIWITTDHMRFDCIEAHGNPAMHTPNLDRLVNEGITFENCFVQNPLCMPSRVSFMTGLYPQQTGVDQNGTPLPPDFEPTVARCFKGGSFQTVQIGKLHFQEHEDNDMDPRARHDYGFDVLWMSEEPGCYEDAYMTWLRTEHPEYVETFRVPRSTSPGRGEEKKGRVLDAPWKLSHSGWVAEIANRYLGCRGRRPRQFLHLGFYAPHPPLNPTREMFAPYADADIPMPDLNEGEWEDKPEPFASFLHRHDTWDRDMFLQYRRHFYAMVTGVDMAVGSVFDTLEESGRLDDTLIVFSSDHGDMCADHRMTAKGRSFFDEIMHQPCVMYWPRGFGRGGRRISGLVEMVDVLPTLLGLSGIPVPEVMVGRDYSEALLAGDPIEGRDSVMAFHGPGNAMVRTETHKYLRYGYDSEVLFDLREQPYEVRNHAADDPETLGRMRELMLQRLLEAGRSHLPCLYRY